MPGCRRRRAAHGLSQLYVMSNFVRFVQLYYPCPRRFKVPFRLFLFPSVIRVVHPVLYTFLTDSREPPLPT